MGPAIDVEIAAALNILHTWLAIWCQNWVILGMNSKSERLVVLPAGLCGDAAATGDHRISLFVYVKVTD